VKNRYTSALADELELGVQGFQFFTFRQSSFLHQMGRRALGHIDHFVQHVVPLLGEVVAEQHQLRAAHDHRAEDEQGAHEREEGNGNTFAHY